MDTPCSGTYFSDTVLSSHKTDSRSFHVSIASAGPVLTTPKEHAARRITKVFMIVSLSGPGVCRKPVWSTQLWPDSTCILSLPTGSQSENYPTDVYHRMTTFRPSLISALTFSMWRSEAISRSSSPGLRLRRSHSKAGSRPPVSLRNLQDLFLVLIHFKGCSSLQFQVLGAVNRPGIACPCRRKRIHVAVFAKNFPVMVPILTFLYGHSAFVANHDVTPQAFFKVVPMATPAASRNHLIGT